MSSLHNSVETVTAAATAIVSAESRVQPSSTPRKCWGRCWRLYWCFGSQKSNKKIIHAVVPESTVPGVTASSAEPIASTAIVMPFIAPPSSPAFQSIPPSATQSPVGLLSVASLAVNAYSPNGPVSIFTIGPYAYETQLVSPPVFSTFTTEPSTACFTPPPEAVQMTTPSSPEVPFAQLLMSSLERSHRNSGVNHKFSWSHYEYQQYPGSPSAQLLSPGSAISTSGTSTPFYDRRCILEVRVGETPRILSFEHFSNHKWGSGHGSGSLTPDGAGLGSRLGSGCLTPDGVGSVSRKGSGWGTPDALGPESRLSSGCLTPVSAGPKTQEIRIFENQIYEATSLANPEDRCQPDAIVDHRVSFELTGEDVARCFANKSMASSTNVTGSSQDMMAESEVQQEGLPEESNPCESCSGKICVKIPGKDFGEGENQCSRRHLSVGLGSILGLCSGKSSFVTPLPQFSEIASASGSPLQSFKASDASPMPPYNDNILPEGLESKDVSGSSSPKEEPNEQFTELPVKRRKRHRRKNMHNQEPYLMRGVYFKNMKWQAAIKVDKKQIHLGTVGSQIEAAHLYDRAAFMCGREPNFELSEEEKKELRKFKWDEFLAMTRSSITCKKHKKRPIPEPQKDYDGPLPFKDGVDRIDSSEEGE